MARLQQKSLNYFWRRISKKLEINIISEISVKIF
jgi:hypothetical protein